MTDLIDRQAALDTIMGQPPEPHYPSWYAAQIEKLPAAQPDHSADSGRMVERADESAQNVQNGDLIQRKAAIEAMMFQEIVVRYPSYCSYPERKGKPYFSIKYTENGQEFIGYSTYKLEVLSEYLKEYFMPSVQPEIIRCKDCRYCDRGIDEDGNPFLKCLGWVYGGTHEEDFCSHAKRRPDE